MTEAAVTLDLSKPWFIPQFGTVVRPGEGPAVEEL